jgi:Nif-specific regulatory protein
MPASTLRLELKVLSAISRIIAGALDLEQTLIDVLGILSENLSMKRATVTLFDRGTGRLHIQASHGLTAEEKRRGVYRLGEGVTGKIFDSGRPYIIPDIRKDPLFLDKTGARAIEKTRLSFIGVPIVLHGEPIGVLNVDRLFGDEVDAAEDIELLQVVATMIAQFLSLNEQVGEIKRRNVELEHRLSRSGTGPYIVGRSQAMQEVQRQMEKVAPTKATVLLTGESGTGKTLIGRIIHDLSERREHPFVKVNCAAIPENLLESELFGYEKGAFTGADAAKPGKFEEAHLGSIFLDEVGELPLSLQAKLLRVIQDREFERLGSNRTRSADVRILAATNKDLGRLADRGRFRPDLYYRLNVFPIHTPPLRERAEDVEALLLHFLNKVSTEYGRSLHFAPEALEALKRHPWPGNVREMENLVERLVILAEDMRIGRELIRLSLPGGEDRGGDSGPPEETSDRASKAEPLRDLERQSLLRALENNAWVQKDAARELGITPRQMGYKIRKYGLAPLVAERRAMSRG